ncbi:tetratricopeptide repeat protein [Nonomuraea sp. MCN248]|uniref:Tetratricopeptide repeat protein n=1 Tax=Nonomuraea corallina TaxID=2989783 RepID=A0ABT4SCF8_9ACTN|nr:tetratricopeptide repeat protein [Nonomuraea corallina]MDA0634825.1 tetratricopeptide repeat protein [Nonomuraea corallina]
MVNTTDALSRARLLLQLGRPADAERELRAILTEEPQHVGAHALLGLALVQQGRTDEALEESREAVRLAPDYWVPHYLSGQVHQRAGLTEEAARATTACLALAPEHAPAWDLLARVHLTRKDWPQVAAAARRGLELEPQNAELTGLLSMALTMLDRHEEARSVAAQAVGNDPESTLAHWARGIAALAGGDPGTAAGAFREVLRLDPTVEGARDYLVHALKLRNPVHRMLSRWRQRFVGGWRLLFLLPALPPVIAVFAIIALLHWVGWLVESWTTLRLARNKATRLLFEGPAARVSLLCCALPVAGALVLGLGIGLGLDGLGAAGAVTMALITPVQEAAHTGSPVGRRVLYGWAVLLAAAALAAAVTGAFVPALLATYAALATVWIAAGVRKIFRPREVV